MLARCNTFALDGLETRRVVVEVDVRPGLPSFTAIGLSDIAGRELREIVRAAVLNSGYEFPAKRVTLNIAPASMRHLCPEVKLAAAAALLAATGQGAYTPELLQSTAVHGCLQSSGKVNGTRGVYGAALAAARHGLTLIAPAEQIFQLQRFGRIEAQQLLSLSNLAHAPEAPGRRAQAATDDARETDTPIDLHPDVVLAATIAAVGRHSLVLSTADGPLAVQVARLVQKILPDLTASEQLEVTTIRDAAGLRPAHTLREPPIRVADPSLTPAALVAGGGIPPAPGELVLAHLGVLFITAIERYAVPTLEALTAPIRDRSITITRSSQRLPRVYQWPADTIVLAHRQPVGGPRDPLRRFPVVRDAALTVDLDALSAFDDAQLYNPTVGQLRDRVSDARARLSPALTIGLDTDSNNLLSRLTRAGMLAPSQLQRIVEVTRTVAAINGTTRLYPADVEVALSLQADGQRLVEHANGVYSR